MSDEQIDSRRIAHAAGNRETRRHAQVGQLLPWSKEELARQLTDVPSTLNMLLKDQPVPDLQIEHLYMSTLLPVHSPELQPVWELLLQELKSYQPEPEETVDPVRFLRYTAAGYLAHCFLYQTTILQPEKRSFAQAVARRLGKGEGKMVNSITTMFTPNSPQPDAQTLLTQVIEETRRFTESFAAQMKVEPTTLEAMRARIQLFDGLRKREGQYLHSFWQFCLSDEIQQNYGKLTRDGYITIGANPLVDQLLLQGAFEDVDPFLEGTAWIGAMDRAICNRTEDTLTHESLIEDFLIEYFIRRRGLKDVWYVMTQTIHPDDISNQIFSHHFDRDVSMLEWVLTNQDQQTLERFFNTIQNFSSGWNTDKKTIFLQNMVGYIGLAKSHFPQNPNIPYLNGVPDEIASALELDKTNKAISRHLSIIRDIRPGIIFLNRQGSVEASLFADRKSQEQITRGIERSAVQILYTSKAQFAEQNQPAVSSNRTHDTSEKPEKEKMNLRLWGEVSAITPQDMPRLTIPDDTALGRLVDNYRNTLLKNRLNEPLLILTGLLGGAHPLSSALSRLGVVGIEQSEGQVMFLIAPKSPSTARGLLLGSLNAGFELEILGAPDDFLYSPTHLTLYAAALMSWVAFQQIQLDPRELPGVRGRVKSWNREAWGKILPRIVLNDGGSRSKVQTILFTESGKPVLLDLQ